MGTFFLWMLGIFGGTILVFRLFGRQILRFGLNKLVRRLMKDAEAQAQQFSKNYDEGNFRTNVYVDQEVKVSVPRDAGKRNVSVEEIAEEIEFEEMK